MSSQRLITLIISIVVAAVLGWFLNVANIAWAGVTIYAAYGMLAFFFLGVLVSNQQYEEDLISKIERVGSAILFSYIIFAQLLYAPIARYFFGYLVASQPFFFSDILALFLFLIFFFLFGTSAMFFNSFSRMGFLERWSFFNNSKSFFLLRALWMAAVLLAAFLYFQLPLILISFK